MSKLQAQVETCANERRLKSTLRSLPNVGFEKTRQPLPPGGDADVGAVGRPVFPPFAEDIGIDVDGVCDLYRGVNAPFYPIVTKVISRYRESVPKSSKWLTVLISL